MIVLSLRLRIQLWFAGLSALLLVVLVTWVSLQGAAAARAALDRSLVLRVDSTSSLCEYEHDEVVCEIGSEAMQQLAGSDPARAFAVQSWPGLELLANGGAFGAIDIVPAPTAGQAPASQFFDRTVGDRAVRGIEVLRRCEQGPHGGAFTVRIVVAEDLGNLQAARRDRDRILVLAALGTLLLFVGAGWFLAHRVVDPLARLAASAQRVQAGHPGSLPSSGNGDEIDRLTGTLNEAFARLQAALARQTRFTADASHELRTPLTILRTQVEVALQRPREGAAYREALAGMLDSVARMTALVEGLLLLARADAGAIEHVVGRVSLKELARQVVAQHEAQAAEKQQVLVVEGDNSIEVQGDARLLTILLGNLLGNAIRYSERPGTIHVRVFAADAGPALQVADEGIGIAADHLPHLFERFVRVDDDRSRRAGGSGLGLSIVQAIAAQHGAQCHITSAVGRGTEVEVRFPPQSGER